MDQQSYAACKKPTGTNAPIGPGPGQAEITVAAEAGYTLVAHSQSGTNFKVEKDASGALKRTCDKSSRGGCQAGGTW